MNPIRMTHAAPSGVVMSTPLLVQRSPSVLLTSVCVSRLFATSSGAMAQWPTFQHRGRSMLCNARSFRQMLFSSGKMLGCQLGAWACRAHHAQQQPVAALGQLPNPFSHSATMAKARKQMVVWTAISAAQSCRSSICGFTRSPGRSSLQYLLQAQATAAARRHADTIGGAGPGLVQIAEWGLSQLGSAACR